MKNIFRTSALVMGLMTAMAGGAISVNAACQPNIQAIVCNGGDCQLGEIPCLTGNCNYDDIKAVICNGGDCQLGEIPCLTGDCNYDDIKAVIEKWGILPDNTPCVDCQTDNDEVSVPETVTPSIPDNVTPSAPETVTPSAPVQETAAVSEYERKVVELVNEYRVQSGLSPLTINEKLCEVARTKSQDMKDNHYFSHTSPNYGSPFDMMKQFGISYRTAGENIAMGQTTPESVVNAWMNSEGHRANIMNPSFTQIGVGYVAEGNYWTQMFVG